MMTKTLGSLAGVKVLDLTHALAGPFCSQVLADHGADVIKVEPLEGDFFRRVGPFRTDDKDKHYGGLFQSCNRNKRSISINLKSGAGRELLKRLAADADVLVENYRAGVLDKMGLGYEALRAINPRLVYTSVRGFGDVVGGESPYLQWPAFDIVAQAMGGWMGITGPDETQPFKVGGGAGDTVPGLFAAFGTLAALWHARATGVGQYVDVSMTDSILAMSELVVSQFSYLGVSPQPAGNGIPGMSPFGTFRARDGVVAIAAPHDPQWAQLCKLMGQEELIEDERFCSEAARETNRVLVIERVDAYTSQFTKQELKEKLGGIIPFSPIYTAGDIFADPHFEVRDMLPRVEHPGAAEPVAVPGVPVKLSQSPGGVRRRAPLLGEHTSEVLGALGMSEDEITQLRNDAVVGGAAA